MFAAAVWTVLLTTGAAAAAPASTDLTLNMISTQTHPNAKCLDGTPPAYYFRPPNNSASSIILFLEGGGWCYPSDIQQLCEPASSHCTANCHIRANSTHGSSSAYPQTMPAGAIEGGTGYTSGDPSRTHFADFAVGYARYCDGGSFSGTRTTPDIALNGTGSYLCLVLSLRRDASNTCPH
jgi:O-palmitoleoyl-L-serine hydrolase